MFETGHFCSLEFVEVMKSCVQSIAKFFCVSGSSLAGIKKECFWQEESKMPFLS